MEHNPTQKRPACLRYNEQGFSTQKIWSKMKKTIKNVLATTLFLTLVSNVLYAQQYIYVSRAGVRNLLRVNLAATQFSLTPKDSATNTAYGVHLSNEVKIISAWWKKDWAFTVHDAFYFDISMGRLHNSARKNSPTSFSGRDESRFCFTTNFGYLLLAGYRNPKWGALGGIDFRWRGATVGDMKTPNTYGNLFNYSRPVVIRGEYCISDEVADKRVIATLWYDAGTTARTKYFSTRLEYPLGKGGRWWALFQYTSEQSQGEDRYYSPAFINMYFKQLSLGFRVQNALL